ncbi:hypothetical protein [Nonomuraea dietziae]|uniref:hypothetical protein n=1 Tax=Nonomuraea dietziae TaxID=65515 RepID=UPI0033F54501
MAVATGLDPVRLEPARAAFTTGMHTVAGISAVPLLGVAVLTAVLLRQVHPLRGGDSRAGGLSAVRRAQKSKTGPVETPSSQRFP